MEQAGLRSLTRQLAEDLGWLEEHARGRGGAGMHAAQLLFAGGLVRNVLGPWLENRPTAPLHIAVLGGAGAGKSTVANFLCGGPVAEANPQAGFTRHPVAYVCAEAGSLAWGDYLGFLGPLKRLSAARGSDLDEDVYQVRRVGPESKDASLLRSAVVWDCPDMTTAASTGYQARLIEVAALADVIVFVASDERYNDEIPTRFLDLFLRTGKTVIVCLVKVREDDAAAFVDHFKKDVGKRLSAPPAAIVTIPHLPFAQLRDPVEQAGAFRERLLAEVRRLSHGDARQRTVQAALRYLKAHQGELETVAREDLAALDGWRKTVQAGQAEFEERYRREFLTGERFRRFDEAYARLVDLLEPPGLGKVAGTVLSLLRTPYRLVRGWFQRALTRPAAAAMPEKPVLEGAFSGWLDHLRKEAARRAAENPLWTLVREGFAGGLSDGAQERFDQGWRSLQLQQASETDAAARRVTERLERQPVGLNIIRAAKLALDATAIILLLVNFGIGLVSIIGIPLAVSLTQHFSELIAKAYVDHQRERVRNRQQELLRQLLSRPLAEWLSAWPVTGGSPYERLQAALARIGPALADIEKAV